jgi:folate-binding Fe-S cluster repair protein YgfZ
VVFVDPRLAALGARAILPPDKMPAESGSAADYDRLRLSLGVPDGSRDLPVEKAILLENGFDELNAIDEAIFDATWAMGDAEHQITMHADQLPEFVRLLVKHLKRIEAAGNARREKQLDEIEARAAAPRVNAELPEDTVSARFTFEPALNFKNRQELLKHLKTWCIENIDRHLMSYEFK